MSRRRAAASRSTASASRAGRSPPPTTTSSTPPLQTLDLTRRRVCEVPNGVPPTGASAVWVEAQPLPSATTLCGSGELAKGYDFTPVSSAGATDDFGNVGGFPCSAAGAPVVTDPYTVGEC